MRYSYSQNQLVAIQLWIDVFMIAMTLLQLLDIEFCHRYRGILVYNICLISINNSVSDGATNKSVLNIERS